MTKCSTLAAAMAILAAACSSGGGSVSATFTGTINGQTLTPKDVVSGTATLTGNGHTSNLGVVGITSASGICAEVAANKSPPSQTSLLFLIGDYDATSGNATAPTAPGTYTVGNSTAKQAIASFTVTDASCQAITADGALATSGTITLTGVSNGAYSGTYDITFSSTNHVTGSFSAAFCADSEGGTTTTTCG